MYFLKAFNISIGGTSQMEVRDLKSLGFPTVD